MSDWTAGPLRCADCHGHLTIDDVNLHTPAWCLIDLSDLWGTQDLRGANRVIPGMRGRKAYRRRIDQTRFQLPFVISGACDENGFLYADAGLGWPEGLEANVAYLQNYLSAVDTDRGDSTRRATFTLPSGNVRRSWVQVLGIRGGLVDGGIMRATLDLLDVEGKLSIAGDDEAFLDA